MTSRCIRLNFEYRCGGLFPFDGTSGQWIEFRSFHSITAILVIKLGFHIAPCLCFLVILDFEDCIPASKDCGLTFRAIAQSLRACSSTSAKVPRSLVSWCCDINYGGAEAPWLYLPKLTGRTRCNEIDPLNGQSPPIDAGLAPLEYFMVYHVSTAFRCCRGLRNRHVSRQPRRGPEKCVK